MFRQAVQDIISCNVGLARRREAFRSLALPEKLNRCLGLGGFFESTPNVLALASSLVPTDDLGMGVLSSHGG